MYGLGAASFLPAKKIGCFIVADWANVFNFKEALIMGYFSYEELVGKRVLHHIIDAKGVLLITEGTILLGKPRGKTEKFRY
jgi:hypothetical protein